MTDTSSSESSSSEYLFSDRLSSLVNPTTITSAVNKMAQFIEAESEQDKLIKNAICGTLLTDLTSKKLTLDQLSLQDQPSIINTVTGTLSFTDMILEDAPHDEFSRIAGLSAGVQYPDPSQLTACALLEDAPHDEFSRIAGLSAGVQYPDPSQLTACALLEDAPHDEFSRIAGLSAGVQYPDPSQLTACALLEDAPHDEFSRIAGLSAGVQYPDPSQLTACAPNSRGRTP